MGNGGYGGGGSGGGGSGGGGSGGGGGIGPFGENPDFLDCGSGESLDAYCSQVCPALSGGGDSCAPTIGRGAYELTCEKTHSNLSISWLHTNCTLTGDVIPPASDTPPETDTAPVSDYPLAADKSSQVLQNEDDAY